MNITRGPNPEKLNRYIADMYSFFKKPEHPEANAVHITQSPKAARKPKPILASLKRRKNKILFRESCWKRRT